MNVLLADNRTKHLIELQELLSFSNLTVRPHWDLDIEYCNNFDLVVFSGGGVTSIERHLSKHEARMEIVRGLRVPFIGICYGFELLCKAYGSTLSKIALEKGMRTIQVQASSFDVLGSGEYSVIEAHQWKVNEVFDPLTPLGFSTVGVEIVKHRDKPHWGLQFHPEVREPANDGEQIFRKILSNIV